MYKQNDRWLSDLLIKKNLLSKESFSKFLSEAEKTGEPLYDYLVRQGLLSEKQILSVLAEDFKLETVDLRTLPINKSVVDRIPVRFASYYKFIPLKLENKVLTIALTMPLDMKAQDEIRVHLGFDPRIVLATQTDINEALKKYYGLAADTIDRLSKEPARKAAIGAEQDVQIQDLEKKSEDASIIKLVNQIMLEAYKKRATDIHIEPYRDKVRFRYRIDGVLVDANLPPEIKHFILPILSRIKIMSNLSIVERRLPQDGSAVVKTKDQTLDLRVSTIPTLHGESMVIRILPTKVMSFSLEKLGLNEAHVNIFRELVKKPHGIIFATGPTGSGKTTTLYSCLHEINSQERKIITIEDPIEYEMEGITQIQVNPKVNLTFAAGLRSVLRHDPDILMVGEVRDLETAEIAIRTALTGHLVFSTLHTNDAASGVTRLIEMGLEPYLVASSIEAFVAQRLVRVICPKCKELVSDPLTEIRKEMNDTLAIHDMEQIKIYRGKGCEHCSQTGYYGRTAIHEILVINEGIRAAILEKPRADFIKQIAIKQGMKTLRQDGWEKVLAGITTPTEVMNVTSKEESHGEPASTVEKIEIKKEQKLPEKDKEIYRILPKEILSTKNDYESRIYIRIADKLKIRYRILHLETANFNTLTAKEDEWEYSSTTKDVSAGGLLFISGHPIAVEAILEIKIYFGDNSSITCLAKVCRVEEDNLSHVFYIAVYYLDIISADRAKIDHYVKQKAAERKDLVV